MNFPTIYGKRTIALAGAMLLCGSMGMAQAHPRFRPARRAKPRGRTRAWIRR